jgi:hypothetical protein
MFQEARRRISERLIRSHAVKRSQMAASAPTAPAEEAPTALAPVSEPNPAKGKETAKSESIAVNLGDHRGR